MILLIIQFLVAADAEKHKLGTGYYFSKNNFAIFGQARASEWLNQELVGFV